MPKLSKEKITAAKRYFDENIHMPRRGWLPHKLLVKLHEETVAGRVRPEQLREIGGHFARIGDVGQTTAITERAAQIALSRNGSAAAQYLLKEVSALPAQQAPYSSQGTTGNPLRWSPLKLTTNLMAPVDLLSFACVLPRMKSIAKRITIAKQYSKRRPVAAPNDSLPMQVFSRLSALTGITQKRLVPETYTHSHSDINFYDDNTHRVHVADGPEIEIFGPLTLSKKNTEVHELLHSTQRLLSNSKSNLWYFRQGEPTAEMGKAGENMSGVSLFPTALATVLYPIAMGFHNYRTAAAFAGAAAATNLVDYGRTLNIKRAIHKYGPDGWIALHAQGNYDPLFAGAILHSLEKRGFITPRGFTKKGETWIKRLTPAIETRLKKMENERNKNTVNKKGVRQTAK